MKIAFIADSNVGKLARWLRMMGYDALYFDHIEDGELVQIAMRESRVVLTRDTHIMKRRPVSTGRLKVILARSDRTREQLVQVINDLDLDCRTAEFTRCMECNAGLISRQPQDVQGKVPPYVYLTQTQYMQCPSCDRIYWRGTHWQRMKMELEKIDGCRHLNDQAAPKREA